MHMPKRRMPDTGETDTKITVVQSVINIYVGKKRVAVQAGENSGEKKRGATFSSKIQWTPKIGKKREIEEERGVKDTGHVPYE